MQVLALLQILPSATPDRMGPLIPSEARHVWSQLAAGTLRHIHFLKTPGAPFPTGVSMMMEVANPAEAEALVRDLPMVKAGLVSVDIHPLAPFTSLAALFAPAMV